MSENKDLKVELSEQVKDRMNENPEVKKVLREFIAALHQANDGVQRGLYKTEKEGVEAILGTTISSISPEDIPEEVRAQIMQDIAKDRDATVSIAEMGDTPRERIMEVAEEASKLFLRLRPVDAFSAMMMTHYGLLKCILGDDVEAGLEYVDAFAADMKVNLRGEDPNDEQG